MKHDQARSAHDIDEVAEILTGMSSIDAAVAKLRQAGIPVNVKLEVWDGYVAQADDDTVSGQDHWTIWPTRGGEGKRFAEMEPRH